MQGGISGRGGERHVRSISSATGIFYPKKEIASATEKERKALGEGRNRLAHPGERTGKVLVGISQLTRRGFFETTLFITTEKEREKRRVSIREEKRER